MHIHTQHKVGRSVSLPYLWVGLERVDELGERAGAGAGDGHLRGAADEAVLLAQVRRRVGVHALGALWVGACGR